MVEKRKAGASKRRRRGQQGRRKRASREEKVHGNLVNNGTNREIDEVDEGFVHYESSPSDGEPREREDDAKRARHDSNSSSDDDDDDDIEDGEEDAEIVLGETQQGESDVEVTLDFYDPRAEDALALETFLQAWTRRTGVNSTKLSAAALAEAVCVQTRVGTTVRVDDEDDSPVGFISCLNVRRHGALLEPLRQVLKVRCGNGDSGNAALSRLVETCFSADKGRFEGEKMGLLLCERVVNMPPLIIPKLLEALFCEVTWAVEDEPTGELREDFRLGWYLYVTEAYVDVDLRTAPSGDKEAKKGKTKKGDRGTAHEVGKTPKTGVDGDDFERVGFVKVEDEAWFKFATHRIIWPIYEGDEAKGNSMTDGERNVVVLAIATKHIPDVRKMVEELVGPGNVNELEIEREAQE